jgi:hypothetical protein
MVKEPNNKNSDNSNSADGDFDIDITPDISALKIFRNVSFTPWYAIGEFVDNSITSALKNMNELTKINGIDYELRIDIDFPKDENNLIIKDNAAGISREDLEERALKTGRPALDTSIGLGKHGVGMKAAGLWWGEKIIIDTFPLNEKNGWHIELDISEQDNQKKIVRSIKIPHRGYSGTIITIEKLWQKTPQSKTITAIRSYLPSIYRSYIGATKQKGSLACSIFYNNKKLTFEYPTLLKEPFWPTKNGPEFGAPARVWRKEINIQLSSGKKISGWVGILEKLNRDMSGFFLKYRDKGLFGVVPMKSSDDDDTSDAKDAVTKGAYKPRKIFRQAGSYTDQSFIGEFDASEFGKTVTTDEPKWSVEEKDEFETKLLDLLVADDYLRMASNYRRKKASTQDVKEAEKSDAAEIEMIEKSLDGNIDHSDLLEDLDNADNLSPLDPESTEDAGTFTLHDREGHDHKFKFTFIKDLSRDFLVLLEDPEKRIHEVQMNLFHPSMNGIILNDSTRKIIKRLGIAITASEVFSNGYDKTKIRTKMNEILRQIGLTDEN